MSWSTWLTLAMIKIEGDVLAAVRSHEDENTSGGESDGK